MTPSWRLCRLCRRCVMGEYLGFWGKEQSLNSNAPTHSDCTTLTPLAVSTILYNIVDSPVGVIPVTRVDPALDALTAEWKEGPGLGSPILEGSVYHGKDTPYDPVQMAGLPVGVQIVGRKWEDEKVLGIMRLVDRALGERGFGPGSWSEEKAKA